MMMPSCTVLVRVDQFYTRFGNLGGLYIIPRMFTNFESQKYVYLVMLLSQQILESDLIPPTKRMLKRGYRAWIEDESGRRVTQTDINYVGQPAVEKLPINKNCSSPSTTSIHPTTPCAITNRNDKSMLSCTQVLRILFVAGISPQMMILLQPAHSACSALLIFLHSDAKAGHLYLHIYFSPQITAK